MIKTKKLKLASETLVTLTDRSLKGIQGGADTRGVGCEPTSGIRPCETRVIC